MYQVVRYPVKDVSRMGAREGVRPILIRYGCLAEVIAFPYNQMKGCGSGRLAAPVDFMYT
jgi:hypothetical protein